MSRVSREESGRQLSLFDKTDYEKLEKVDQAVDKIRKKYGQNAIMRASFLKQPIENGTDGHPNKKSNRKV